MTSRDFVYWLQGFFELNDLVQPPKKLEDMTPIEKQILCVRNHLNMVFKHEIDPSMGDAAHQAALSQAHQGGGSPVKPSFHGGHSHHGHLLLRC